MTRRMPPSEPPRPEADDARDLWQKYRRAAAPETAVPDALDLAAYAENRLRGTARDRIETYLARHPHALADVIAARATPPMAQPAPERRQGLMDGLGWGAALCGFCLALWFGFATGEQAATADTEAYVLYSALGDENVDL